jgi:hypothetical protein
VITTLACVATGIGLYAFARHRLGDSWWTLVPSAVFWLSPMVHDANLYDFHIITVSTALIVWTVWAFDTGRTGVGWSLLILALLCNEDVAWVMAMFGVYIMLTKSQRTGLLIAGISAAYFVMVMGVLVPAMNDGHMLTKLEGPDSRINWGARPGEILEQVLRPDRLRLPLYFLISGAIAALREWRMLLLLLPVLAEGLLANTIWMTRITGTYYWVTAEAVIILACILAAERCLKSNPARTPWSLIYLGGMTVAMSLTLSPLPYGMWSGWKNYELPPTRLGLQKMMSIIPKDAAISVQNNLGPHLSHRREIAAFPRRLDKAAYALFHLRYIGGPDSGLFVRTTPYGLFQLTYGQLGSLVWAMARHPDWGLIAYEDGFYLFARGARSSTSAELIRQSLESDYDILVRSYRMASQARSRLSPYLVGPVSWEDVRGKFRRE